MNALEPTSRDSIITVNLVLLYFIAACQEVRVFFWVKEISEKLDINVIKNKPKEYNSEYSH